MDLLAGMVVFLYFSAASALLLYGLNCYVMVGLFWRRRVRASEQRVSVLRQVGNLMDREDVPVVTTQIAIYNEYNVSERAIRAACQMRYPAGKHEIQVLDDSTDETRELVGRVVDELRGQGHDVHHLVREKRTGFKAGALAEGLAVARGDFVGVFDADFVPPEDYLLKVIPFFMTDSKIGLVQARWGHLNRERSLLTRAQSVGIDGHFMVEQAARNWNGLFMNFNGTAGVWSKQAIADGGGWQWDTLTEDMDLSYRVQLAGWKTAYVPDMVVPAELPEDVNAFKSQQFRWAKGSIQTARKILPVLLRRRLPLFTKIQAFFHMTHYAVHPMMLLLSVLALPVLIVLRVQLAPALFVLLACILGLSMLAPSTLYCVSQRAAYRDWLRRLCCLPFLVVIGVGIALSNTRGVVQALAGHESDFVRTPKRGDKEVKKYEVRLPWWAVVEILLGLYCSWSLGYYLSAGKYFVGPFLAAYAAGFLFVGMLTVAHAMGWQERHA